MKSQSHWEPALKALDELDYVLSSFILDQQAQVVAGALNEDFGNPKELAASVLAAVGANERLGSQLLLGEVVLSISEFRGGLVFAAPLSLEHVFGVVAEPEVNLGMLRMRFRESLVALADADPLKEEALV
ncbi:MAG: hypothetical protein EP343_06350 [Deltaproteobacteria bacterium]|nr:MAG: hypothetical protein EP343_06350 [Deltaproteobacteria bacterium]